MQIASLGNVKAFALNPFVCFYEFAPSFLAISSEISLE